MTESAAPTEREQVVQFIQVRLQTASEWFDDNGEQLLASEMHEAYAALAVLVAAAERAEVTESEAAELLSDRDHFAQGLIRIAGDTLDGMTGWHFVGDENAPDECPGCVARRYLNGTARATLSVPAKDTA